MKIHSRAIVTFIIFDAMRLCGQIRHEAIGIFTFWANSPGDISAGSTCSIRIRPDFKWGRRSITRAVAREISVRILSQT